MNSGDRQRNQLPEANNESIAEAATAVTLPSITATHELVVPRSMPMMSAPPAAWLAALALRIALVDELLRSMQSSNAHAGELQALT